VVGGSNNAATNNNASTAATQEVLTLSGHAAPVEMVRFHPHEPSLLCTAAADATVRFWDVRWAKQRGSMGRIDIVKSAKVASSVEWCSVPDRPHYLVVTQGDCHVHVYDTRKLTTAATTSSHTTTTATSTTAATTTATTTISPIRSLNLQPNFVESARFSPAGNHLMAAVTVRAYGMGEVHIIPFSSATDDPSSTKPTINSTYSYPAHTGSIYSQIFSPNGRRYATGGADAMVGLWDVPTMICTHTIARRAKFIRSLSFSHDSKLLASSSEDDGIDLADACNGDWIGTIPLSGRGGGGGGGLLRGGGFGGGGGADEIAFHPKSHILACARGNFSLGGAPVVIAKIAVSE
jgi:THO complex subunit 3